MNFQGREIDAVALWERYVDFPENTDMEGPYLPLVLCPNPDHENVHTPAFQVNIKDGLVHCFARCGISGTFTHAISMIEGCNEREARRIVLEHKHRGKPVRRSAEKRGEPTPDPDDLEFSTYIPPVGQEYLERRGISGSSVAGWNLGWDYENKRLVIPAHDIDGEVRFLIKRAVKDDQWPKYLYEPEGCAKNSLLFGACKVDPGMIRSSGIVLTEGSLDAIRLHQHGFSNTVATLGTGISEIQRNLVARLRPRRVFLFFDRDASGIHGIDIAQRRFGNRYPLFIVRFPAGRNDPAELSGKEVSRAIERAIPIARFHRHVEKLAH